MNKMNADPKYILERYSQGGRNRYDCPGCGKRKCFTRYIDTETGNYLADECGKCDHENSCGYHYPPRELFADHPELRPKSEHERIGGSVAVLSQPGRRHYEPVGASVQSEFYPLEWAEEAMRRRCTFTDWLRKLPFDRQRLEDVLSLYYVGGTREHYFDGPIDCGPAVVYWLIDEMQRPHDAKFMAYGTDGHRAGNPNWLRSICVKAGVGPQLEHTDKVFFGMHLLNSDSGKPVGIVESEKSALICACRYPEYIWMATGGCGNLNSENLRSLMDRRIGVFPDSGEYAKWKDIMDHSGHRNYHVSDLMERYEPNTDIADLILDALRSEQPQPSELQPSASKSPSDTEAYLKGVREQYPALVEMESVFGEMEATPIAASASQTASLDEINTMVTNPKQHGYEND